MAAVEHVVLIGLMGCGKTTVGRLLAARLGWPLDDSDAAIERRWGADVRELNRRLGTERMHALEAEHLRAAVGSPEPSVVAAAASIIDDPDCRAALQGEGVVAVWLDVAPEAVVKRFAEHRHRPQFAADLLAMFAQQRAERAPLFERVCTIHAIDAGRTAQETAGDILAQLPHGGR